MQTILSLPRGRDLLNLDLKGCLRRFEINEQAVAQKEAVFCDVHVQVRTYSDDFR